MGARWLSQLVASSVGGLRLSRRRSVGGLWLSQLGASSVGGHPLSKLVGSSVGGLRIALWLSGIGFVLLGVASLPLAFREVASLWPLAVKR